MNRTFFYIIPFLFISVFTSHLVYAQINLVPNPSFEDYDTCPTLYSMPGNWQIEHCLHWYAPTQGTSDYLNVCCSVGSCVHIPNNCFGFQYPYDGNAYMGMLAYYIDTNNLANWYREYIQTKLNTSLVKGQEYYFEFYVCRGEWLYIAIDRIGALFTSYPISRSDAQPIIANPQIENPRHQIITDTINWTKISGTFTAEGGESYLTIGNFYPPEETDTLMFLQQSPENYAYYYIDGMSLKKVDSRINVPNVFTPNGDGYNDTFLVESKSIDSFKGEIYNRWGVRLFEWNDIKQGWNGKYKGNDCAVGVYYYIITAKGAEGKEYNLKGSVELLK